jgi:uncharacterized protein (TIGR02594 family)
MKYVLVIFLTLLVMSFSHAAPQKSPVLRSVFKPLAKKSSQIELIRLYQDKSFEHLIYSPDRTFKGGVSGAFYYSVAKNTGRYSLESGKMKLTCLDKNFPCKLYGVTLYVDNSKVYENRFRALFKKKEYVLRSAPKEKYNQPYFMDPENGRVITNQTINEDVAINDVVRFIIKGETEGRFKIKAIVSFLRKNIDFTGDETDNLEPVMALLAGRERKAGSSGIARIFAEMLRVAGLPAQVIQGELNSGVLVDSKNRADHFWNAITLQNSEQLYDISLGDEWMNVDPAIMIHSHFPKDPAHQFLEVPLSKGEYERLVYSAPTRENASYALILPAKGEVHIKDQMELLVPSNLSIVHAEIIPIGLENSASFDARLTSTTTSGKTRVVIPIKEKNALLKVRTSSGMELTYHLYNDGMKDDEIDGYYHEMRSIAAANRKIKPVANDNPAASQKVSVALPAVLASNSLFRGDLMRYQLTDFTGFDHPMVRTAVGFYGLKELTGAENNPKIVEFFHATGNTAIHNDETHWCSAFIMYCAKLNRYDYPKNALARSWMRVGEKVEKPEVGDLVVFGWGESYHGHVVIFLGEVDGMIIGLGGNQDDEVNVMPFSKESILGYRRLN